ncbi:MAG: glycerol-3-phosphate dehydrogenase/oxidase [Saprospiraceae bacterium]|nr:MAG: glycerol-3-phosphate dehydrogenase/oxidase [Saprospiraceae bacterium]
MNQKVNSRREAIKSKLRSAEFDLLIIGGGITGAGIALDAALRGMKVALVEKGDFASGTSSHSTKLIHGGLRYLKQLEFRLVSEVGRERTILHQLAPHLVLPEKMLLPIVNGGTFGKASTYLGLWLYDLLAGVRPADKKQMLSAAECLALAPLLKKEGLLAGGLYAEYRTDDARLTLEVLKPAMRHGAVCLNYTSFVQFHEQKGTLDGATCRDELTEEAYKIKAAYVVNATGPWVDELREKARALTGKRLFLSKGVHVVLSQLRFPLRQAVYFEVPGGRMMFAIPRHRCTYLGTTDTPFKGDLNHVWAKPADVEYILAGANFMFPSLRLGRGDVESTWAGLRPLIYEKGETVGETSRKDEIFIAANGLISMAGGKLTGYRKMAERVVDILVKKFKKEHGKKFGPCRTAHEPLAERPFRDSAEVTAFEKNLQREFPSLATETHLIPSLVEAFGRNAANILAGANNSSLLQSELDFCFANEMVVKPLDFLVRRTGHLYFDIARAEAEKDAVLEAFSHRFGWSEKQQSSERAAVEKAICRTKVHDC